MPTLQTGTQPNATTLTIAISKGAKTAAIATILTAIEQRDLCRALDQLIEIGALATYDFAPGPCHAAGFAETLALLRERMGAVPVDAAVGAAPHPATPTPKPEMLVPVWPFEPVLGNSDALIAFGIFSGMPIAFEAMPVKDDYLMQPSESVVARFTAWRAAVDRNATLGSVTIPRQERSYAVFASLRAG